MMAQLKTLDTTYLKAQDPDQHASLAIAAVAIVWGVLFALFQSALFLIVRLIG